MSAPKPTATGLLLLGIALPGACGASFDRVEELPGECSPGEEVVREVTKECGDQHCTCTSAGQWRCISPPCTPTMGIPPCNPGRVFRDQVRQRGELCSRTCVCKQSGPHDCGEFECVGFDAGAGVSVADGPDESTPEPCRTLECPAPSRLEIERRGGDVVCHCASPDGGPRVIRRHCHAEGHWEETVVVGGGDFEVHSLHAQGRIWKKSFSYRGKPVLSCDPLPSNHLDCQVAGADIIAPECWKKARLPQDEIRVLSSADQWAKLVPCAPASGPIDWSHTHVVMLRQQVSEREKLIVKVHHFDDRTDVVALVEKRCESRLRQGGGAKSQPTMHDIQAVFPMPRDGTELRARIERSDGYCLGRPGTAPRP